MSAILLSPHSDDAVLFASFLILTHQPRVITVLRSKKQERYGIKHEVREAEDVCAMDILGVGHYEQWPEPDDNPDWDAVRGMIRELDYDSSEYVDRVFAPAVEENGHEQHNEIGAIAVDVFGSRVTSYLTYCRGSGRSTGREIMPEPWMIADKLRALSCYESQMGLKTGTQTWFLDGQREYLA